VAVVPAAVGLLAVGGTSSHAAPAAVRNGPLLVTLYTSGTTGKKVGIYRRDPNGHVQALVTRAVSPDQFPTWSRHGDRIAFVRNLAPAGGWLMLMNPHGTAVHRVGRMVVGSRPAWGPRDRLITFATNTGVWVVRRDGSALECRYRGHAVDPAWSPDGRTIVFGGKGGGLFSLRGARGAPRRLIARRRGSLMLVQPAWSPDGRRLAFVDVTRTGGSIDVARADGSGTRTIVKLDSRIATAAYPSWSPNGRSIAFGRLDALWVVNSQGGTPPFPLIPGEYVEPSWAPD
jgi:Tol biopolymer transport system component